MTTRGAGGLKRLALGSVAQALVRHAHLPVLLVTPASQ
jgi:nucleotide-binding universal stress UspA family protein